MHTVTLSLLDCLAANLATAPRRPRCLQPSASRPLAAGQHQWMAPALVWARGSQGGVQGLPPPAPQVGSGVHMHTGQGLGRVANKLTISPCEMPESSTGRPGRAFTTKSGISLHTLQGVQCGL